MSADNVAEIRRVATQYLEGYLNADVAALKEHDFGGMNFTDFMQLLKRDGEWKIISKAFSTF